MKLKSISILLCGLFYGVSSLFSADLRQYQDESRVLKCPDKGWYHHYYDSALGYYLGDEEDILSIPNMHHFLLRFAWCFLEPEEGKYNWKLIDEVVEKWYPLGIKFSLYISCLEPDQAYATPKWVFDAGAKYIVTKNNYRLNRVIEPDPADPIFLEKLEKFHKAIAERYDGKPYIVDITLASIGVWGEGHYSTTGEKTNVSLETIKKHIDIFKRVYKKSQLTIGDDWLYNNLKLGKGNDENYKKQWQEAREYVKKNKITYRDDSLVVACHTFSKMNKGKNSLLSPELFDDCYPYAFGTFEMGDYWECKKTKTWVGKNGSEMGGDVMRKAIKRGRCTFLGYHGDAKVFAEENPDIIKEFANKLGYWYFINSADVDAKAGTLAIEWENRGCAHAFNAYELQVKIEKLDGDKKSEAMKFAVESGNKNWEPDQPAKVVYSFDAKKLLKDSGNGEYQVSVKLVKHESGKEIPVEIGFKEELRDSDGFYRLINFNL